MAELRVVDGDGDGDACVAVLGPFATLPDGMRKQDFAAAAVALRAILAACPAEEDTAHERSLRRRIEGAIAAAELAAGAPLHGT